MITSGPHSEEKTDMCKAYRIFGKLGRLGYRKTGAGPADHALNRRRRRLLVTTETELMAMAAAARAGFRVQPQTG